MQVPGEEQLMQPGAQIGVQFLPAVILNPGLHLLQFVGLLQLVQFGEQIGAHLPSIVKLY